MILRGYQLSFDGGGVFLPLFPPSPSFLNYLENVMHILNPGLDIKHVINYIKQYKNQNKNYLLYIKLIFLDAKNDKEVVGLLRLPVKNLFLSNGKIKSYVIKVIEIYPNCFIEISGIFNKEGLKINNEKYKDKQEPIIRISKNNNVFNDSNCSDI
ncbi:MAG: hypothetical protein DRG78_09445 [Epsilonproteobacteria bacterium]|nr:MAG: hypothetical protein DRG78_09445 [Campylobacterota bacterium]